MPPPKNVSTRWRVRSKNWSGITKLQRLVLFLERSDGGNGDDALDPELLEGVDIGAEIQFARQDAVATSVARQKGNFAAFECTADKCV